MIFAHLRIEIINALQYVNHAMCQVKALADYVNFKICSMLLRSGSSREAAAQFKSHISCFMRAYCEIPWRHNAWVSDQYIVFAQVRERERERERVSELLAALERD